jgi:hypothetical protein
VLHSILSTVPCLIAPADMWLSEWFVDLTMPTVDPVEGWSYAASFDAPTEAWSPNAPTESSDKAVRRRRWVRVLRRRLDRPPLPFADLDSDAELADLSGGPADPHDPPSSPPLPSADYLARARWQAVGIEQDVDALSVRSGSGGRAHARRMLGRLEGAVSELRNGLASAYQSLSLLGKSANTYAQPMTTRSANRLPRPCSRPTPAGSMTSDTSSLLSTQTTVSGSCLIALAKGDLTPQTPPDADPSQCAVPAWRPACPLTAPKATTSARRRAPPPPIAHPT